MRREKGGWVRRLGLWCARRCRRLAGSMLQFLIIRIFPAFSVALDGEKLLGKNRRLVLLSFAASLGARPTLLISCSIRVFPRHSWQPECWMSRVCKQPGILGATTAVNLPIDHRLTRGADPLIPRHPMLSAYAHVARGSNSKNGPSIATGKNPHH